MAYIQSNKRITRLFKAEKSTVNRRANGFVFQEQIFKLAAVEENSLAKRALLDLGALHIDYLHVMTAFGALQPMRLA